MTFGKSYSSVHTQTGEVRACEASCNVSDQDLEQGISSAVGSRDLERGSRLEFSGAQDTQGFKRDLSCVTTSLGSDLGLTPDPVPTKPNGYQALKPLSLWCTLMIVLYFLQGCFQDGSALSAIFSTLSAASLILLPIVAAVVAWKYFRALNAYHKALEKSE